MNSPQPKIIASFFALTDVGLGFVDVDEPTEVDVSCLNWDYPRLRAVRDDHHTSQELWWAYEDLRGDGTPFTGPFRVEVEDAIEEWLAARGREFVTSCEDRELEDGGLLEAPDGEGVIRRRDPHGEMMEARAPGEGGWREWADLWSVPPGLFADGVTPEIEGLRKREG